MKANHLLNKELNRLLLFASQMAGCNDAFISLKIGGTHHIASKIGLTAINSLDDFTFFEALLQQKSQLTLDLSESKENFFHIAHPPSFDFMVGFPVKIANRDEVVATFCVFGSSPTPSQAQLKTLKNIKLQIVSLLQMHFDNKTLKAALLHKTTELDFFVANATEFIFHLDVKGNFTFLSTPLDSLSSQAGKNLLGTHFSTVIHPKDLPSCTQFLENVLTTTNTTTEHAVRIKNTKDIYIGYTCNLKLIREHDSIVFLGIARKVTKIVDSQHKLQEQKEFYEKILNELPTGIAVYDQEFRYKYLNPAAIQNKELRKFAIGKTNFEYEQFSDRDLSFAENRQLKFEEALLTKKTIQWSDEILNKTTGLTSYHDRTLTPVFFQNGTLDLLIGIGTNSTESIVTHKEMVRIKILTINIVQNVAVGILVQGPDSEIIEYNNAACEMLGLTQEQLIGKTSYDKHWSVINFDGTEFKPENHPVPQAIKQLRPINNVVMGVHRPHTNDLVWLLVDAVPVFDSEKKLLYVVCSFNDITVQKKAEIALKISNERFAHSSTATSDLVWDWDLASGQIFIGDATTGHFGYNLSDNTLQAKDIIDYIHPDDVNKFSSKLNDLIKSSELRWQDACRIRKFDGMYASVKVQAVIIRDETGKTVRMIGAMRDITSEEQLQIELQQSEKQFKDAFNNSGVGMAIVDLDGNMKIVNNQILTILGYSSDELRTMTLLDLSYPEDKQQDVQNLDSLVSGKLSNFSREKRYKHKNGSIVWGLISVSLIKNAQNDPMHFIKQIIDITHKKAIEKSNKLLLEENIKNKALQLHEVKNMYRLLAENTVDLVCSHSLDGTLHYISPSIKQIFGYKVNDLLGLTINHIVHPEDVEELQKSMQRILEGKEDYPAKIRFRRKDFSYIWCEIKGRLIQENGVAVSFHTSIRDITQTKKAEFVIEKTLKRERELNELRTNLVSTVSHEFRTPMTTIRSSAELISIYLQNQKIKNEHLIQKRITTIIGEIDRIVSLMTTVLIIAKNDVGKTTFNPTSFDLKQTCLDAIEICEFEQKDGRKVQLAIEGNPLTVFADKNLMEYILLNVLNNAFKYSDNSGKNVNLKISQGNNLVFVEITDFGIGIPIEDQHKLFNTFFRASNSSNVPGTGLGLYIVKTFTERNGGTIKLQSKEGKGTKVLLQFPLVEK
ncbi:PAS domain S-box protein [Flavobacterium sp. SM2513]|uniref:PAS domain S-box protein n=1 Tax=Flavobacterium sp. SM2513 TaxID=3424766 RepID=UPI003D7FC87E